MTLGDWIVFILIVAVLAYGLLRHGSFSKMMEHHFDLEKRLQKDLERGRISPEEYSIRMKRLAACR